MLKRFIATLILLTAASISPAQSRWVGAACAQPGTVVPHVVPSIGRIYQWIPSPEGNTNEASLMLDGRQVGGWNYDFKIYRPCTQAADGSLTWGPATATPPLPPPPRPEPVPPVASNLPAWMTNGVNSQNVGDHHLHELHSISGKDVSNREVVQAFEDSLTDQSGKLWLMVIDSDKDRRSKVVADITASAELQPLLSRSHLKSYPPGHPHLKDRETGKSIYVDTGEPTIYLLAQDGKVLHRQNDYKGVDDLQALRKADPKYDPSKDPDLRRTDPKKPDPSNPSQPSNLPLYILAAGGAWLFLKNRKPAQETSHAA